MKRWVLAVVLVVLALWPLRAQADPRIPDALGVASVTLTCMYDEKGLPSDTVIGISGTIHEVTLLERARPFMVLRRVETYPPDDPWLANQPTQPPMKAEVIGPVDEQRREILRYTFSCLGPVLFPPVN